jgi:hypothetical protein
MFESCRNLNQSSSTNLQNAKENLMVEDDDFIYVTLKPTNLYN